MKRRVLAADAWLVLTTLFWGSSFVAIKDAVRLVDPLLLLAVRFGLGALVFVAVLLRARPTRAEIVWGTLLAFFLWSGNIVQTIGLVTVTPARSAFLTSLSVILVPVLTVLLLRRWPPLGIWMAVLLATAGLVVLYWTQAGFAPRAGDLLTLACAALFSGHILVMGGTRGRVRPLPLCAVQLAVSAVAFWALVPFAPAPVAPIPLRAWGSIVYLATVGTVIPFALQAAYQPRTTASRAAVIYTLEPLFASVFAAVLIGARFTGREIAGSALILAGAMVAALWKGEERSAADATGTAT